MGCPKGLRARNLTLSLSCAFGQWNDIGRVLTAAAMAAVVSSAHAQAPAAQAYDIPPGPLAATLSRLGSEAGILLSINADLTRDRQSNGVRGTLSVRQALDAALAGTGLEAQAENGGYRLKETPDVQRGTRGGPASAAGVTLAEVRVVASAEHDATTEGTGSYATNAPSATSTRLPLEWQETPQSLTVITRQRLDDRKLDTVSGAVETAVGVTAFRQSMGSDLNAGLMSRGFSIANYEVDGIPSSSQLRVGESTVLYDRVEIVRGATGLMSGLGSPGATVNLMRKRPTVETQRSISIDAGSWNRRGATADLSGAFNESGSLRGRLVVDARNSDSWVDRLRSKTATAYGILEADLTDATLATVGFSYQQDRNTAPQRTGFPLFNSDGSRLVLPRSFNSSPDWTYYDENFKNAFVSLEHRLDNGWRGKLEYNYRQFRYDGIVSYLDGSFDPITGLGGVVQPAHWIGAPEENALDGYVTGHFPLFGRQHELVAGFTVSRTENRDAPSYGSFLGPWTGYDGTIGSIQGWTGSANVPVFDLASRGDTKVEQDAAYVTSRLHLTDAATLVTGARITDWKQTTVTRPVNGVASRTVQQEKGIVTPYAGLVYRFDDTWSAYTSYTQIFNPQPYGTLDINGRQIDPEEGTSIEGGVKANLLGNRLQASASVFRTRLDNSAMRDESIASYRVFIARKGLTSRGFEFELAGEPLSGWNLSAGYAFTATEDAEGARTMTQIPRNSVKLFTTYRLPGALRAVTVGGGISWQSENGYPGYYMQGSYALASLLARYEINRDLTATLNIQNLFDRNYYTGTATHALYGAPRNAVVTLKYKF